MPRAVSSVGVGRRAKRRQPRFPGCVWLRVSQNLGDDVLRAEKQKSNFLFNLFCLPHYLCDYKSKISTNSREHYNPIISDNKGSGWGGGGRTRVNFIFWSVQKT